MTSFTTILTREALTPVASRISNPLSTAILQIERHLKANAESKIVYKNYLETEWPTLVGYLVRRALKLEGKGSALRGAAKRCPDANVTSAVLDLYKLIDNSVYYTSYLWRAFYYWLLKDGAFNPRWPMAQLEEMMFVLERLTEEELEKVRERASQTWSDFFEDREGVNKLFKAIQRHISYKCYKSIRFLAQSDPAIHSLEDLQQEINSEVLASLRSVDYYQDDPSKMIGYAKRSVDNAVQLLREHAMADRRAKIIRKEDAQLFGDESSLGESKYLLRERAIHTPYSMQSAGGGEEKFTLGDSIKLLGEFAFRELHSIHDQFYYDQILELSSDDPKIQKYFKIILGNENSEEFWAWFSSAEPALAMRPAYIDEQPHAIGPWVQRWLELPSYKLEQFLADKLPEILDSIVQSPSPSSLRHVAKRV